MAESVNFHIVRVDAFINLFKNLCFKRLLHAILTRIYAFFVFTFELIVQLIEIFEQFFFEEIENSQEISEIPSVSLVCRFKTTPPLD